MFRLKQLIHEVHRRSLWQVLGIYVVGGWIALQIVDTLAGALKLPDWAAPVALVILIIGLPLVLATAFVQEGIGPREPGEVETTSGGTPIPAAEDEGTRRLLTWRNAIAGGVVAFALWGVFSAAWMLIGGPGAGGAVGAGDDPSRTTAAGMTAAPQELAYLSVDSEPAGARVIVTAVDPAATFGDRQPGLVGETPVIAHELAAGEYLVRLGGEDTNELAFLVTLTADDTLRETRVLVPTDDANAEMVLVSGGRYPGAPDGLVVQAFLMDRHEVTNAEYLEFVSAGGYDDRTYWPALLSLDDEAVPWSEARKAFVDATGMPGPRGWSGGIYPQGKADHPVVGVSRYEAAAYARWAGKDLPTWHQWWRAALGAGPRTFPWGDDVGTTDQRANFGQVDTRSVESHAIGVSAFGAHDMAGNAREWIRDIDGKPPRARSVGGSWNAPSYTFEAGRSGSYPPAFADAATGFRCVRPLP